MKPTLKHEIISAIVLFIFLGFIGVARLLIENDQTLISVSIVLLVTAAFCIMILEAKGKKEQAKKDAQKKLDSAKEFSRLIEKHSQDSEMMKAIHSLFSGESELIQDLINKHNLVMDFDFIEKDGFYSLDFYCRISKKELYYSSVTVDNGKPYLYLFEWEREAECPLMSKDEIINAIAEDIQKYFEPECSDQ